MEIQQLRYAVALAQELHFQRAAERVHVTQPTLSQAIQKLERELGTYLFERSPQGVRLTAAGEKLLPYAISILDTIEKAKNDLTSSAQELSGRVILAAIPTIGPYILPSIVKTLRKKAPNILLELHELTTSVLLKDLREGKIDLGILSLPIDDSGLAVRSVGSEPFYLAVPLMHALSSKKRVSPGDVRSEKLLMLQEGHCFRDQSLDFCRSSHVHPQVVFQGSSLISVLHLVQAGEGITFVPQMAIDRRGNPGVVYIPFSEGKPEREIGIVWRMSGPLNRAQSFVLETAEKAVSEATK